MARNLRKRLLKIGVILMICNRLLSRQRAAMGIQSSAFARSRDFQSRLYVQRIPCWPPKTSRDSFGMSTEPASIPLRLFATKSTSSADESSTTTATQPPRLEYTYEEFVTLAAEIRRHDALYYNDASKIELSDEEYDALVELEAALCQKYPKYLAKIQKESGLGKRATRYGGRVGLDMRETAAKISEKLSHVAPMLSLDNVHNTAQLQQWLVRVQKRLLKNSESLNETNSPMKIQLITEPKLDGLSLSLRYRRDGNKAYKFQWAATRGDGRVGQNVTTAAMQAGIVPQQFDWSNSDAPDMLEVRGEIVLPLSNFQQVSSNFSNARNAASGILLRKTEDMEDKESRKLRSYLKFYAYDIVLGRALTATELRGFEDGLFVRAVLETWGFHVPEPVIVTDLDLSIDSEEDKNAILSVPPPMLEYYYALMHYRLGENSTIPAPMKSSRKFKWGDYEMDGAVHKVSSLLLRSELGSSNRSPRWAVAHKFPSQTTVTSLLGIEVQVGRTGALTPVAVLEPVDLGGVSVRRATLHNFGHMQQVLGDGGQTVPRGAKVMVRRAGDVIPQVVQRVLQDATPDDNDRSTDISLDAPLSCPACGAETFMDEATNSTTSVGQVVRCGGPSLLCPPRAVSALAHAFSRDALDVTGLSEARIQQLVDEGILHRPSDLFRLVPRKDTNSSESLIDQIAELPGWGPKSAQNLADAAERIAKKGISLGRFIFSLNIRHVGQFSSNLIASTYGTAGAFLEAVEEASRIEDDDDRQTFSLLRGDDKREGTKGIGPVLLSSLVIFSRQRELVQAAKELAKAIPVQEEERQVLSNAPSSSSGVNEKQLPWTGLAVVFTGSLPGMSRTKAQDVAREMGAKSTPGSVSKSTDIVVVGANGGKKAEQAQELGILVLEADEFLSLVEEFSNSS